MTFTYTIVVEDEDTGDFLEEEYEFEFDYSSAEYEDSYLFQPESIDVTSIEGPKGKVTEDEFKDLYKEMHGLDKLTDQKWNDFLFDHSGVNEYEVRAQYYRGDCW